MKKALLAFNLAVALVLVVVIARDVSGERQREIESAYKNLEFATAALAEHTQQTLAAIDLALITVVSLASGTDWNDSSQFDAMQQVVENRQRASTNTFAFYILDAEGQLLITSRTPDPNPADLSMTQEYIVHRDGIHDGLYIATSRIGSVGNSAGRWIINLSRRIETTEGDFMGVAAASLSVDYLVSFYDALRLGEYSAVGLLSTQGTVLARSPMNPDLLGLDISENSQFIRAVSFADVGRATDMTLQDGITRLSAFRYTWGNQLIAYANIAEPEVLAGWRERTVFKLSIAALMMLLFIGGSTSVMFFTRRKQQWTESRLREQEHSLAQINAAKAQIEAIFTSISDAVYSLDADWRFVYLNAEAERVLERSASDLVGKHIWEEFPDTVGNEFHECYTRARRENRPMSIEQFYPPLKKWFSVRAFPHDNGLTVYLQDVTQRLEFEERLRQSQKMDALGQLTGGIAHDFNNLLTVILGNIDLLLEDLADKPEHIRNQADVIRLAGERAAELTHRLLAFARRQPLNPQRTDVNQLVQEAQKLLSRTVGEHIHIELVCSADLWVAIVDPHELQNAILNLAINSRDAMPEGGRLTIETANMAIDADYAQAHNILPGQYVMIAVSDTGEGMTADVADKAFDPFFTTKPEGQGSGLGLAMVHGFVHQSGGFAKIYSEPGQGTTVRLYLPRVLGSAYERDGQMETDSKEIAGGNERILLVEDDPLVRRYAVDSLSRLGYQVTECVDGEQALVTLEEGAHYHMLLTDVVLAGGVSGKQVAAAAMESDPQMKILFMSGYAENAIVHHGRLDRGVNLISKPFRAAELARRVRGLLDAKGRSGATVDA